MAPPNPISYILLSLLPFITSTPLPLNNPMSPSSPTIKTTNPLFASSKITCHAPPAPSAPPIILPISIPVCRPVLNWIRTLPSYRLVQPWEAGNAPRIPVPRGPATPPYVWHKRGSGCMVRVGEGVESWGEALDQSGGNALLQSEGRGVSEALQAGVRDRFSFEQVRALATDVLQECEGVGYGGWVGIGGSAEAIGSRNGWVVDVRGAVIELA